MHHQLPLMEIFAIAFIRPAIFRHGCANLAVEHKVTRMTIDSIILSSLSSWIIK